MPKIVEIPDRPPMTEYSKVNIATEEAFTFLLTQAKSLGLSLNPVMGLMYMPKQETTRQFQEACRAVIHELLVTKEEPNVEDSK